MNIADKYHIGVNTSCPKSADVNSITSKGKAFKVKKNSTYIRAESKCGLCTGRTLYK